MPALSIITINLNNADGLEKTISSVAGQTFTDFEYIVVDGASTDGSIDVINKYKSYITHYISEKDSGIYQAMNKGIKMAKGTYCLFLNSGDYLTDNAVLQKIFSLNHSEDILYGDMMIDHGSGKTEYGKQPSKITLGYMVDGTLWHPVSFIRKTLFDKSGYYNEEYKIVSDFEFFLRTILVEKASTKYIPIPVAVFNTQGIGSSQEYEMLHQKEKREVLLKYFPKTEIEKAEWMNALKRSVHHPWVRQLEPYPMFQKLFILLYRFFASLKNLIYHLKILSLLKDMVTFNRKALSLRRYWINVFYYRTIRPHFIRNFGNGKDIKLLPVIINNRNRITYLLQLINWLERNGYRNIYIIDNHSTYPPLLEYYKRTEHKVFYLNENMGHLALWKSHIFNMVKKDYYIYSDPDVVPVEDCPDDVIELFMRKLIQYHEIEKIGFGLKIDDLPDAYKDKKKVIEWESQFWKVKIEPELYDAHVDTTFALYKPFANSSVMPLKSYRTGGRYVARHLPWYEDSLNPEEENVYYKNNVREGASHWISANEK